MYICIELLIYFYQFIDLSIRWAVSSKLSPQWYRVSISYTINYYIIQFLARFVPSPHSKTSSWPYLPRVVFHDSTMMLKSCFEIRIYSASGLGPMPKTQENRSRVRVASPGIPIGQHGCLDTNWTTCMSVCRHLGSTISKIRHYSEFAGCLVKYGSFYYSHCISFGLCTNKLLSPFVGERDTLDAYFEDANPDSLSKKRRIKTWIDCVIGMKVSPSREACITNVYLTV